MASSILKFFIGIVFLFSTIYTCQYYYFQGSNEIENIYTNPLDETDGKQISGAEAPDNVTIPVWVHVLWRTTGLDLSAFYAEPEDIASKVLEPILELISWASPFVLIKGLFFALMPPDLYEPFNLLILRPVGWIGTWITGEWVINKIRGSSES